VKKNAGPAIFAVLIILNLFSSCSPETRPDAAAPPAVAGYDDLLPLFREWREFQKPVMTGGVPDYTPAAMKEQIAGLEKLKSRLAAIDPLSWPIPQRVDYLLVRAEMNGLEFDHRVLRPWSRDPGFYNVINFEFAPQMYGALVVPTLPLAEKDIPEFRMKLRAIPKILEQAKGNLVEEARDLWFLGLRVKKNEAVLLAKLSVDLAKYHPGLVPDAFRAGEAVDDFRGWIEGKLAAMTAASGIGVDNYNWYMKNVLLVPYTWRELVTMVERELQRATAFLKLDENRNRRLSPLKPIATEEEFRRRFDESARFLMEFMRREEIMTVPDWLHVGPFDGKFTAASGSLDFFTQVEYHDPQPLRCHGTHTMDELREARNTHPIRGVPRLYFIDGTRAEGLAVGNEEMMLQAGLFEKNPRARELVYILLANRAARALGDLRMHSNEFTLEQAVDFAVSWTPRGWLPRDGDTIWFDEQLYLRTPGYGMGYVVGKIQLEKFMADRARQLGDRFVLKNFMNEFIASGMIPIPLSRWETTGLEDEVKKLW
jgi:hypothetical protein